MNKDQQRLFGLYPRLRGKHLPGALPHQAPIISHTHAPSTSISMFFHKASSPLTCWAGGKCHLRIPLKWLPGVYYTICEVLQSSIRWSPVHGMKLWLSMLLTIQSFTVVYNKLNHISSAELSKLIPTGFPNSSHVVQCFTPEKLFPTFRALTLYEYPI